MNLAGKQLLDTWAEEDLMTGTLSNGTVGRWLSRTSCHRKNSLPDNGKKSTGIRVFPLPRTKTPVCQAHDKNNMKTAITNIRFHTCNCCLYIREKGIKQNNIRPLLAGLH